MKVRNIFERGSRAGGIGLPSPLYNIPRPVQTLCVGCPPKRRKDGPPKGEGGVKGERTEGPGACGAEKKEKSKSASLRLQTLFKITKSNFIPHHMYQRRMK